MLVEKKIVFQHEPTASGGYVYLSEDVGNIKSGKSVKQVVIDINGGSIQGGEGIKSDIVLDFDENGKIYGIEIMGDVIPDELKKM